MADITNADQIGSDHYKRFHEIVDKALQAKNEKRFADVIYFKRDMQAWLTYAQDGGYKALLALVNLAFTAIGVVDDVVPKRKKFDLF